MKRIHRALRQSLTQMALIAANRTAKTVNVAMKNTSTLVRGALRKTKQANIATLRTAWSAHTRALRPAGWFGWVLGFVGVEVVVVAASRRAPFLILAICMLASAVINAHAIVVSGSISRHSASGTKGGQWR